MPVDGIYHKGSSMSDKQISRCVIERTVETTSNLYVSTVVVNMQKNIEISYIENGIVKIIIYKLYADKDIIKRRVRA